MPDSSYDKLIRYTYNLQIKIRNRVIDMSSYIIKTLNKKRKSRTKLKINLYFLNCLQDLAFNECADCDQELLNG